MLPAAYAARLLADLGTEVIKLEPHRGRCRGAALLLATDDNEIGTHFTFLNFGKQSAIGGGREANSSLAGWDFFNTPVTLRTRPSRSNQRLSLCDRTRPTMRPRQNATLSKSLGMPVCLYRSERPASSDAIRLILNERSDAEKKGRIDAERMAAFDSLCLQSRHSAIGQAQSFDAETQTTRGTSKSSIRQSHSNGKDSCKSVARLAGTWNTAPRSR